MDRFVCIHGHFYQPPRENPWLETIELQDSAAPYHDWNERITAECYGPNARSRILDGEGRIASIVNNYSRISFNFGPTLLAWMEQQTPEVYGAVIRADRESLEHFGGHGSAMAQAYNHMILPLANPRDRTTQVGWGLRDFAHRFGREPEGMWLPETAVDADTLDVLARAGVRYTVLAPHQARRVRRKGARKWDDVGDEGVDTTVPYSVRLPGGRSIAVFFYDGPVSQAVAFEELLVSGERLADRLLGAFPEDDAEGARLVHIATDGETYGHHHRHGDMALAYALEQIEAREGVRLTNYGEFLELRPPEHEVEIADGTSWSCAHGVGRWQSDCGCNMGRGWHQRWRGPLREALDWLREAVEPLYEERGAKIFAKPWAARDDYVDVVLDRSPGRVNSFLDRHAGRELEEAERIDALKLLELQRHAMLMYTSCGWFFDELSGIETTQVLQYAGRTIQLAEEIGGEGLEEPFLERLEVAESNLPEHATGRDVYERYVRPAMVDLTKVAAHYAATSLFEEQPEPRRGTAPLFVGYAEEVPSVYCYEIDLDDHQVSEAGRTRLAVGRLRVTSEVTREWADVSYGALHFGDHNLNAAARAFLGDDAYREMVDDVTEAFQRADLPEVVRRFDRHFGLTPYSLRTLFRDEQRKVLDVILGTWLEDAETAYRRLYEEQAPIIRFLADLGVPLPGPFRTNAELVVNARLAQEFSTPECDPETVREILDDTATWRLELDVTNLAFTLGQTVAGVAASLRRRSQSGELLERLEGFIDLAQSLPWPVELDETQTLFYEVLHETYGRLRERGDAAAVVKADRMRRIGEKLAIRVE